MTKKYTKRQLQEAVSYWRSVLKGGSKAWAKAGRTRIQIREAVEKWENELSEMELDERDLTPNQKKTLIDYVRKNGDKVDPAKMKKQDWIDLSKELFPKSKVGGDWLRQAVEAAKDGDEKKVETALEKAADPKEQKKAEAEANGAGKGETGKGAGQPSAELQNKVAAEMKDTKAEDLGVEASEEAADKEATTKPIGQMNLMDRLRRLHNATVKNVITKLKGFLPWATKEGAIIVENSCVDEEGEARFVIPDDGNMFIRVKVKVDDANRKGFKKFIGGMFGKAMNEEELDETLGEFFGGIAKGIKNAFGAVKDGVKQSTEDAKKAYTANLEKVNEEMKKRIGVAAIQEYVTRFCGKALAKKVNYQVIQVAIENEGTEDATYVFTGCIKITK